MKKTLSKNLAKIIALTSSLHRRMPKNTFRKDALRKKALDLKLMQ